MSATEAASTNRPDGRPAAFLDYDKSLACIHCGLCLGSCPTYLETGNENDSPRGRIYLMRAVQEGRLPAAGTAARHIDLCLGCRACEAVCPSGVEYGGLLEHTRDHIEKNHRRSWLQTFLRRIAIEQVFPFPERLEVALAPVKAIRALGLERWMPQFIRDALALVPRELRRDELPEFSPAATSELETRNSKLEIPRAGFIRGCVMPVMFAKTNANSVQLLNDAGYDVHTPVGQGCCGALHAHSGRLELARECARRNIEVFERLNPDVIVINAAGCGSTLKEYGALLADDPTWAARGRRFSAKLRDLTEVLKPENIEHRTSNIEHRTTYHDACHLAHAQRITKPPRALVKAVAGTAYVELPESDVCCGSGGTYNLTEPEMAGRLQRRKIDHILATGAKVVVTSNPGCLLQIRAGLTAAGADDVRVIHLADYLAESAARR